MYENVIILQHCSMNLHLSYKILMIYIYKVQTSELVHTYVYTVMINPHTVVCIFECILY